MKYRICVIDVHGLFCMGVATRGRDGNAIAPLDHDRQLEEQRTSG